MTTRLTTAQFMFPVVCPDCRRKVALLDNETLERHTRVVRANTRRGRRLALRFPTRRAHCHASGRRYYLPHASR